MKLRSAAVRAEARAINARSRRIVATVVSLVVALSGPSAQVHAQGVDGVRNTRNGLAGVRLKSLGLRTIGLAALLSALLQLSVYSSYGDDGERILAVDHFVSHVSSAPAVSGQTVQLYVRERVQASVALTSPSFSRRVVLFVHGATIPSEVYFDAQYQDYSWMAYLAQAGLDVFGMDITGYGPSTRPGPMDDPCNVAPASQPSLVPSTLPAACPSTYAGDLTTIASDRDDIDAVVDYIRSLRHVDKISLVAWSRGGPRAGPYVATHPDKIDSLVMLAPAYLVGSPPDRTPTSVMGITTRQSFDANWDNQIGCADQYDPGIRDSLWSQLLQTDPTGATWGPGAYRAPTGGDTMVFSRWGALAVRIEAPTLLLSGEHDKQVLPENVRALYADLRTPHKVFAMLACSSHLAAWETRHVALFQASAEWLLTGSVNGVSQGELGIGE
ncbi:MAG: alpha/beta fold hydrolase [Pseudonocardiales bacterium]